MKENGSRIGAAARDAGVSVQTLRYYERRGLLPAPARTVSGYRRYGPETARVVRFIKRGQELGFTLSEIAQLLGLRTTPRGERSRVLELATAKVADIDQRIAHLSAMRSALAALVDSCECGSSKLECSILEALSGDE